MFSYFNFLTVKRCTILACLYILLEPSLSFSQENKSLVNLLLNSLSKPNDTILSDSVRKNIWLFKFPQKNGDPLVSYAQGDLKKEMQGLQNDCKKAGSIGEIEMGYEVKKYVKGNLLSILVTMYFDCNMPSPDYSTKTYNYISYNNMIYSITLKQDDHNLNKLVDSLVKIQFDKECLDGVEIGGNFQLYFGKGIFIDNPLHTKACNESLEIKDAIQYFIFKKNN